MLVCYYYSVCWKLYESVMNILVQNQVAATQDASPENELDDDHRHSTNDSTKLRVSADDDDKIAAVTTCSPSESIHRSTEKGCFIQLLYNYFILFLQYI